MVGPSEAEDLVQDTLLEFLRSRPGRHEPGPIRAWLEKRMRRLAEDRNWDRHAAPDTYSYEALGGE